MTPLNTCEVAVGIVVRGLQPVVAATILPGGDAAPADDARVEVALVVEKRPGSGTQIGTLEVTQIT